MKRNVLFLISAIIGTLYLAYIIYYFFSANTGAADSTEALGAGIATALVLPHMILLLLAVIFNWLGWARSIKWAALVGAILYSVAALLFLLYAVFVLVEIVLSFVGYAKLRKQTAPALQQQQ